MEVWRLPPQILAHVTGALSFQKIAGSRLPRRDRVVRQWREGHVSTTDQPRSQHQSEECFRVAAQAAEAMGSQVHYPDDPELSGEVQVDGAYFGGHIKPENRKADRKDRRFAEEQTGKRQVVVVAREVRGRTLPFVVPRESEAVPLIRKHVASGSIIHADESNAWERLHASYDVRRVNHSVEYKAEDGANVNQAESYFSRLRRAEIGQHHRLEEAALAGVGDDNIGQSGVYWGADGRLRGDGRQSR